MCVAETFVAKTIGPSMLKLTEHERWRTKLMFLTKFVTNGKKKHAEDNKSNLMQLFCAQDSPVHSQLYENVCLQVEKLLKYLDKLDLLRVSIGFFHNSTELR